MQLTRDHHQLFEAANKLTERIVWNWDSSFSGLDMKCVHKSPQPVLYIIDYPWRQERRLAIENIRDAQTRKLGFVWQSNRQLYFA